MHESNLTKYYFYCWYLALCFKLLSFSYHLISPALLTVYPPLTSFPPLFVSPPPPLLLSRAPSTCPSTTSASRWATSRRAHPSTTKGSFSARCRRSSRPRSKLPLLPKKAPPRPWRSNKSKQRWGRSRCSQRFKSKRSKQLLLRLRLILLLLLLLLCPHRHQWHQWRQHQRPFQLQLLHQELSLKSGALFQMPLHHQPTLPASPMLLLLLHHLLLLTPTHAACTLHATTRPRNCRRIRRLRTLGTRGTTTATLLRLLTRGTTTPPAGVGSIVVVVAVVVTSATRNGARRLTMTTVTAITGGRGPVLQEEAIGTIIRSTTPGGGIELSCKHVGDSVSQMGAGFAMHVETGDMDIAILI